MAPLEHSVVGLTIYEVFPRIFKKTWGYRLVTWGMVIVMASLPDIDVFPGLILENNAALWHRGPTHSIFFGILFAIICFYFFWKFKFLLIEDKYYLRLTFVFCLTVVLSHLAADIVSGDIYKASVFWPFTAPYFSASTQNFREFIITAVESNFHTAYVYIVCALAVLVSRIVKYNYIRARK